METSIVPLSVAERDAILNLTEARLSTIPREDEDKHNQQIKADMLMLNLIYLGTIGDKQKMGQVLITALTPESVENATVENGEICIEADMRTKEDRRTKTELSSYPLVEASEIAGKHLPDHPYKRALLRIKSYTTMRVLLTGPPPEPLTLARCSIRASAFYGKEDDIVAVMFHLLDAVSLVTFQSADFVRWVFKSVVPTLWFSTKLPEYCTAMDELMRAHNNKEAEIPKAMKDAVHYRSDNMVVLLLGQDADNLDAKAQRMLQPMGVSLTDYTNSTDAKNLTNFDTKLNKDVPRYQMELRGIQWRQTTRGLRDEPPDSSNIVKFQVTVPLWSDRIVPLTQIHSTTVWKDLAPCIMPYAQIFLLGQELAGESNKNRLNRDRLADGPGINQSTQSDRLSFVLHIGPSVVIADPIDGFVRRVGIPVTAQGVRSVFNGTSTNCPADVKPAGKLDTKNQAVICVSEYKEDVAKLLSADQAHKWEFRVVTNVVGTEPGFNPVHAFGKIKTPEEGDRLVAYLAEVLAKGRNLTREQFCAEKKWTPLPTEALMKPGGYVFRGTGKWLYVYFINKEKVRDDLATFQGEVEALKEKAREGKGIALPSEFKELLALPEPPSAVPNPAPKRGREEPEKKQKAGVVEEVEEEEEEEDAATRPPANKKPRIQPADEEDDDDGQFAD